MLRAVHHQELVLTAHVTMVALLTSAVLAGGCLQEEADMPATTGDLEAALQGEASLREPGHCSVIFRKDAVIAADPSIIFDLLVDLEGYASWNPWVVSATGDVTPGSKVEVEVLMNGNTQRAEHIIEIVEPGQRFCWSDTGWNSLFVYAHRCRTLEPRADGTIAFRNELMLDGIFAPMAKLIYGKAMEDGMAAETAAVKQVSETP